MPHLIFDYSGAVAARIDMAAFAETMRKAMLDTGVFPAGGIRVRGHEAAVSSVGDGGAHDFLDMTVRIGAGRSEETKRAALEAIYAAAESALERPMAGRSFALSLELREIDPALSIKRFNTIRDHLQGAEHRGRESPKS